MDSNFLEIDFNNGYRQAIDDSIANLKGNQVSLTQMLFKAGVKNRDLVNRIFKVKHSEPYLKGYEEGLRTFNFDRIPG
ncbi:hypothetical protein [Lactobacillus sp. Sy-1]|uniref:hypothetical protein n=1 Tax=Lactobacillus sp. Sy-1 TaxID=2109645 RepID=UPI001C5A946F|nr:hypothetical protein [Lactobacillus sp. Sy-1]MBW1606134.1 hypothetical protein [Lactobacillus sp. Sy-1]